MIYSQEAKIMKKTTVLSIITILLLSNCGKNAGTQNIVGFPTGIGVVVGNELRFYEAGRSSGWTEDEDYKFTLPL
jgi:hypothetical protein